MKLKVLRLLGILVAVLVLGTVALAVAIGAQSPGASQIPTVVTNQPTATPAAASLMATSTPSSVETTSKPAPAKPPTKKSSADKTSHTNSDLGREVVTPKLREGDGGDDGSPNGGGSDSSSSSSAHVASRISAGSAATTVASRSVIKRSSLRIAPRNSSKNSAEKSRSGHASSTGHSARISALVSSTSRAPGDARRAAPIRSNATGRGNTSTDRKHVAPFGDVGGHRSSGKNVVGRGN